MKKKIQRKKNDTNINRCSFVDSDRVQRSTFCMNIFIYLLFCLVFNLKLFFWPCRAFCGPVTCVRAWENVPYTACVCYTTIPIIYITGTYVVVDAKNRNFRTRIRTYSLRAYTHKHTPRYKTHTRYPQPVLNGLNIMCSHVINELVNTRPRPACVYFVWARCPVFRVTRRNLTSAAAAYGSSAFFASRGHRVGFHLIRFFSNNFFLLPYSSLLSTIFSPYTYLIIS